MQTAPAPDASPHIPVVLDPILTAVSPVSGCWLDGTFGAGGYTRALLEAGASRVLAVDRDPEVFERAQSWVQKYASYLILVLAIVAIIVAISMITKNISEFIGLAQQMMASINKMAAAGANTAIINTTGSVW